jgi:hypothetical protein
VLLESHQAALQQLGEEKQADVAAMELDCEALRVQLADKEREAEELRRQLEEDADKEIEELKDKYEQRLQVRGTGWAGRLGADDIIIIIITWSTRRPESLADGH